MMHKNPTYRVAYICRRTCYPLGIGGAEMSAFLLLRKLRATGHDVLLLGEMPSSGFRTYRSALEACTGPVHVQKLQGGRICTLVNGMRIALCSTSSFSDFYAGIFCAWPPQFILTHLDGSLEAVSYAQRNHVPCIHFVRDCDHPYNFAPLTASWIDRSQLQVVANSRYIQEMLAARFQIASEVVYPEPSVCDCDRTEPDSMAREVRFLFVNPHVSKGLHIARHVALSFPGQQLHTVEGWDAADQAVLADIPNVFPHSHQSSLCDLYSTCDILLVPSQSPEAFGRVALEGLQHGLVVVASGHSGLAECVGDGGILVTDFCNPKAWVAVLDRLVCDRQLRRQYCDAARRRFDTLESLSSREVLDSVLAAAL